MNNIFENAYFGKAYKTRDGRKAIYLGCRDSFHILSPQDYNGIIAYKENGLVCEGEEQELDIVSEWQEEINEEELHKLATEYDDTLSYVTYNAKNNGQETELEMIPWGIAEAFKAGYRKAKKN